MHITLIYTYILTRIHTYICIAANHGRATMDRLPKFSGLFWERTLFVALFYKRDLKIYAKRTCLSAKEPYILWVLLPPPILPKIACSAPYLFLQKSHVSP